MNESLLFNTETLGACTSLPSDVICMKEGVFKSHASDLLNSAILNVITDRLLFILAISTILTIIVFHRLRKHHEFDVKNSTLISCYLFSQIALNIMFCQLMILLNLDNLYLVIGIVIYFILIYMPLLYNFILYLEKIIGIIIRRIKDEGNKK